MHRVFRVFAFVVVMASVVAVAAPAQVGYVFDAVQRARLADPVDRHEVWREAMQERPDLANILLLESHRIRSRDVYDSASLRRQTEDASPLERAGYLLEPWLWTAPDDPFLSDEAPVALPMDRLDHASFGESLRLAQQYWQEAETALAAARVQWERDMRSAFEQDADRWQQSFADLSREQHAWQLDFNAARADEEAWFEQQHAELERQQIAQFEAEQRAVQARRGVVESRLAAVYDLYQTSRNAERTARAAADIWRSLDIPESVAEHDYWGREAQRQALLAADAAEAIEALVSAYAGGRVYGSHSREIEGAAFMLAQAERELDVWEHVRAYADDASADRDTAETTTLVQRETAAAYEEAVRTVQLRSEMLDEYAERLDLLWEEQDAIADAIRVIDQELHERDSEQRQLLERLHAPSGETLQTLLADARAAWDDFTGGGTAILDADTFARVVRERISLEHEAEYLLFQGERHAAIREHTERVLYGLSLDTAWNALNAYEQGMPEQAHDLISAGAPPGSTMHAFASAADSNSLASAVLNGMLTAAVEEIEAVYEVLGGSITSDNDADEVFAARELERMQAQLDILAGMLTDSEAEDARLAVSLWQETTLPGYALSDVHSAQQVIADLQQDADSPTAGLNEVYERFESEYPGLAGFLAHPSVLYELSAHQTDGWHEAYGHISARAVALQHDYLAQYRLTADRIARLRDVASDLPAPDEAHAFLDAGSHHDLRFMTDAVPGLLAQYAETVQALMSMGTDADDTLPHEEVRRYAREHSVLMRVLSDLESDMSSGMPDGTPTELFAEAEELLSQAEVHEAQRAELYRDYEQLAATLALRTQQVAAEQTNSSGQAATAMHDVSHRIEELRRERSERVVHWVETLRTLNAGMQQLAALQADLDDAVREEGEARHAHVKARSVYLYATNVTHSRDMLEQSYVASRVARDEARQVLTSLQEASEQADRTREHEVALAGYGELMGLHVEASFLSGELDHATRVLHEQIRELEIDMLQTREELFEPGEDEAQHEWLVSVSQRVHAQGTGIFDTFSLARYAEEYETHTRAGTASEAGFLTPQQIVSPALFDALSQGGTFRTPIDLSAYLLEQGQQASNRIQSDPVLSQLYQQFQDFRSDGTLQENHELSRIEYLSAPARIVEHAAESARVQAARNRRTSGTLFAIGMGYYLSGLASFFSPPLMATLILRSTVELGLAAAAGRAAGAYEELHRDLSALSYPDDRRHGLSELESYVLTYGNTAARHERLESDLAGIRSGGLHELPELFQTLGVHDRELVERAERFVSSGFFAEHVDLLSGQHDLRLTLGAASGVLQSASDDALGPLQKYAEQLGSDDLRAFRIALQGARVGAYGRFSGMVPIHHQHLADQRISEMREYHRLRLDQRDAHDLALSRHLADRAAESLQRTADSGRARMREIQEAGLAAWREAHRQLADNYERWLSDRADAYERGRAEHARRHAAMVERSQRWAEAADGHAQPHVLAYQIGSGRALPAVATTGMKDTDELDSLVADLIPEGFLSDTLARVRHARAFSETFASAQVDAASGMLVRTQSETYAVASDLEVRMRVQQSRARDAEETARRLSLAHAGTVLHDLRSIRSDAAQAVESANESVARGIHRGFTQAGFRREADGFVRETLVGSTMNRNIREQHRIRAFRPFTDHSLDPHPTESLAAIAALGSREVLQRIETVQSAVADELQRVFGTDVERLRGGTVDPDAIMEIRRSLERGWIAELLDYGDGEEVLTRRGGATMQPGAFGRHVGYAPELFPVPDTSLGWRRNIAFAGRGELHELYGPFLYYQALQAAGYGELGQGFHNVRLWDGSNAFSLADVMHVGAGIAGGFLSGGASLALSLGTGVLTSALDVVSGEADMTDFALAGVRSVASAGVGHLGGLAASGSAGLFGQGLGGQLVATAADLSVATAGNAAAQALQRDGFSVDRFVAGVSGPQALARAAGRLSGTVLAGDSTGFSGAHAESVRSVAGGIGSVVELGLEHGLTGSATVNLLNFADLAALSELDSYRAGAAAGMAELKIGGGAPSLRLGSGGVDLSAGRIMSIASGLPIYREQLRIAAHRLTGKTEFLDGYSGTRSAGTALRSLYSYGSGDGKALYEDILSGAVRLRIGDAPDDVGAGTFVAQRLRDGASDVVHLAGLGDRGWNPSEVATRLFAGLVLEHEAHRDGLVGTIDAQHAETVGAVRARLDMADRMMSEYGLELSQHELTVSELLLFRMAEELGDPGYFDEFVQLMYGSDRDYFFLPVVTGGETQTDNRFANVVLLSGYSREEVDRLNQESLDAAWDLYTQGQLYEAVFESKEAFGRALRQDSYLAERYEYTHRNFISIREYGCVLFSMAYMLRTATDEHYSIFDLNDAMVENGLFIDRTLLSSETIADAMNLLAHDDIEFSLVSRIDRPTEDDFLDAHFSDDEYIGLLRIAGAGHIGADDRERHGVHSEALRNINVDRDEATGRYRVRSVNTANPYTGSWAYAARTEREIDEFARLDLFRVIRRTTTAPARSVDIGNRDIRLRLSEY